MTYYEQLFDLPELDLATELQTLLANGTIHFDESNQICINTVPGKPDDYLLGKGSLKYNWAEQYEEVDENGNIRYVAPEFETPLKERDFTELCSQFKGTQFETVYNALAEKYLVGRVRIMRLQPRMCMSWHVDSTSRVHYPIRTQTGCFMLIEDELKHLPSNTWWYTHTRNKHTAMNASNEDRIHLVAVIREPWKP